MFAAVRDAVGGAALFVRGVLPQTMGRQGRQGERGVHVVRAVLRDVVHSRLRRGRAGHLGHDGPVGEPAARQVLHQRRNPTRDAQDRGRHRTHELGVLRVHDGRPGARAREVPKAGQDGHGGAPPRVHRLLHPRGVRADLRLSVFVAAHRRALHAAAHRQVVPPPVRPRRLQAAHRVGEGVGIQG